jgi:hypothetical protein
MVKHKEGDLRLNILRELGGIAVRINTTRATGFGPSP